MPHQCLGCGKAFETGSKELLKGCPGCKGTRFFYTDKVLDDGARAAKAQEAKQDLRTVLEQMAREEKLDTRSLLAGKSFDDWVKLDPQAPAPAGPAAARAADAGRPADTAASTSGAASRASTATGAVEDAASPDTGAEAAVDEAPAPPVERPVGTVQVHEPGSYTLDVERLLNAEPIVIEKQGVYMIHLASVFEAPSSGSSQRRNR